MAERLIQDATDGDSELRCREQDQRLQEVLNEGGLFRPRRKTAQDEHTELERSVEQLRHDQDTSGGVGSNLEKEMELLFAEADALRQEGADRMMKHAELQHRLQCVTPCRKRVAKIASPTAAEAARASRHRPNLETALRQKVIHHHECAQAEKKW